MAKESIGVLVARFQPLDNAHLALIRHALGECGQVVVVVDSHRASLGLQNPFSTSERLGMIRSSMSKAELTRMRFTQVRDRRYDLDAWAADVEAAVTECLGSKARGVKLYLSSNRSRRTLEGRFPDWTLEPVPPLPEAHGHVVRESLFLSLHKLSNWKQSIPREVARWIEDSYLSTPRASAVRQEADYVLSRRTLWSGVPYLPTFVTTDAVVLHQDHVLLVRRKLDPGRGLLALPGGYLDSPERIEEGMLRELIEETRIQVDSTILRKSIRAQGVFDYPWRSSRGRTITHAFLIDLGDLGARPRIEGADDAQEALWLPLEGLESHLEEFFEDHFEIIEVLMARRSGK